MGLVNYVASEIQQGNLSLPEVADTEEVGQAAISSSEFELLPKEIKEKFSYVENLIISANQAASESASEYKYEELVQGDNEAALQAAHDAKRKKLDAINEAERKSDEILD